jgi:hypothetical protein
MDHVGSKLTWDYGNDGLCDGGHDGAGAGGSFGADYRVDSSAGIDGTDFKGDYGVNFGVTLEEAILIETGCCEHG